MHESDTTPLTHIFIPPIDARRGTSPAVIMLHGRGADEHDLPGLGEYLGSNVAIISVRAPMVCEFGGYAWYEMYADARPEPATFLAGLEKLNRLIDEAIARYPVSPESVFLLGFSMGAVMAYAVALSRPGIIRGVMACSGYIPEGVGTDLRWEEARPTQFFIAHGTHDSVIPVSFARRAKQLLEEAAVPLTYREYPMAHQISEDCVHDMAQWFSSLLHTP